MKKIEEKLKKAHEGALAILEIKLIELERKIRKKNIEISKFSIPYLSLSSNLKEYLSFEEIKNQDSKYKNIIDKYWRIKNEK